MPSSNKSSEVQQQTQPLPLEEEPGVAALAANLPERMRQLAKEVMPNNPEPKRDDIAQEVPVNNGNKGGQPSGAEALEPPATSLALATTRLPEWGVGEGWLAEFERMALRVAKATILPEALKGDARNVLAVALAGRELGLGFMEATRQIHIIKGQTALSAELKLALAKRDGLVIDKVDESNGCRIEAHRKDTGEAGVGEFTPEDKKQAGLHGAGWDNYPKDLYWARAVTRLVRRLAPDAKGASFRSVEEVSDEPAD